MTGRRYIVYEQDICAGEIIGEVALEGVQFRCHAAIAVTNVELIAIEKEDYESAFKSQMVGDSKSSEASTDSRIQFLAKCPLLSPLSTSELLIVARLMKHKSYNRDVLLMTRNIQSKHLCFIMEGKVDISQTKPKAPKKLTKWQQVPIEESDKFIPEHGKFMSKTPNVLLTLLKHSYYGESGLLTCWQQSLVNPNLKKRRGNEFEESMEAALMVEKNDAVADTPVELLLLSEDDFYLLPDIVLHKLRDECGLRVGWRGSRKHEFRAGRSSITNLQYNINSTINRVLLKTDNRDLESMRDTYHLERALEAEASVFNNTASGGGNGTSGAMEISNYSHSESGTDDDSSVNGSSSSVATRSSLGTTKSKSKGRKTSRRQSGTLPILVPKTQFQSDSQSQSLSQSHGSLLGDGLNESVFDDNDSTIRSHDGSMPNPNARTMNHASNISNTGIAHRILFGSTTNSILFDPLPQTESNTESQSQSQSQGITMMQLDMINGNGANITKNPHNTGPDGDIDDDDLTLDSDAFTDTYTDTVADTVTEPTTDVCTEMEGMDGGIGSGIGSGIGTVCSDPTLITHIDEDVSIDQQSQQSVIVTIPIPIPTVLSTVRSQLIPSAISRVSINGPSFDFDDCHIGKNNYATGIAIEQQLDKIRLNNSNNCNGNGNGYTGEDDLGYQPNASIGSSSHSVLSVMSKTSLGDLSITTNKAEKVSRSMQNIPHKLLSGYDPLLLNATCKAELEKRRLKQIRNTAIKRAQIPVNNSFMKKYNKQMESLKPKKNPNELFRCLSQGSYHISFPVVNSPSMSPVVPHDSNPFNIYGDGTSDGIVDNGGDGNGNDGDRRMVLGSIPPSHSNSTTNSTTNSTPRSSTGTGTGVIVPNISGDSFEVDAPEPGPNGIGLDTNIDTGIDIDTGADTCTDFAPITSITATNNSATTNITNNTTNNNTHFVGFSDELPSLTKDIQNKQQLFDSQRSLTGGAMRSKPSNMLGVELDSRKVRINRRNNHPNVTITGTGISMSGIVKRPNTTGSKRRR